MANFEKTFDNAAFDYDKSRPIYAKEIYDDIFSYKQIYQDSHVLEIGMGTGKAAQPIEGGDDMAMLDVSESGRKIGEKLFAALDPKQKKELIQYFFERDSQSDIVNPTVITPNHDPRENQEHSLTKIYEGDLYFCLEHRVVCVRGQEIDLTAKEFDILALLIMNSKRVFTYEMIIDIVWHEDCDYYSRKAINNHVSNLRKKLKVAPDVPDYIKSVHSVGYKFDI